MSIEASQPRRFHTEIQNQQGTRDVRAILSTVTRHFASLCGLSIRTMSSHLRKTSEFFGFSTTRTPAPPARTSLPRIKDDFVSNM